MFWRTAPKKEPLDLERVKKAIVRVGPNGRGFMTGGTIVTTAHLLPNYPKFKYQFGTQGEWDEALTDELLLGRLGEKLTVKARCTFADPFSNIAMVSGSSEGYRSFEYWEDRLPIHAPLRPHIAGAGRAQVAWIFSIDCKWIQCVVKTNYDYLTFVDDQGRHVWLSNHQRRRRSDWNYCRPEERSG